MSNQTVSNTSEIEDLNRSITDENGSNSLPLIDEVLINMHPSTFVINSVAKGLTGIWDISTWDGTDVWDDHTTTTNAAVLNEDNTFIELFRETAFKGATTSASWNTTTFKATMDTPASSPENVISGLIAYRSDLTITKATLTALDSIPTNSGIAYYLSADNGSNYELVTNGTEHTFTNSGKYLLWKAILTSTDGSANPEITQVQVTYQ